MNLILSCLGRRHDSTEHQRVPSILPGRPAAVTMLQQGLETIHVFPWILLKLSVLMEFRPALNLSTSAALDKILAYR